MAAAVWHETFTILSLEMSIFETITIRINTRVKEMVGGIYLSVCSVFVLHCTAHIGLYSHGYLIVMYVLIGIRSNKNKSTSSARGTTSVNKSWSFLVFIPNKCIVKYW